MTQGKRWNDPQRCWACGAADSRDAAHQRGCPALPEVSFRRRFLIALECEDAWRAITAKKQTGKASA